jgi:hypothetical protein
MYTVYEYITVYLVISVPKLPYMHCVNVYILADSTSLPFVVPV